MHVSRSCLCTIGVVGSSRGAKEGKEFYKAVNGTRRKGPDCFAPTFDCRSNLPGCFRTGLLSVFGLGMCWHPTRVCRIALNAISSKSYKGMR